MIHVEPRTVVVFGDLTCPWATLAIHRLHTTRERLGLADGVRFDLRSFPLEVINGQPTPKRTLDAEIPVVGALDPSVELRMWQGDEFSYPVTSLLALEAVQAAKEQSLEASARLDRALRRAFFTDSRCIALRSVILEVAGEAGIDVDALRDALDDGRARRSVVAQRETSESDAVKGSPHLFLPDGSNVANPGVEMHWEGEHGEGFPVVDRDDPSVYEDVLKKALASAAERGTKA